MRLLLTFFLGFSCLVSSAAQDFFFEIYFTDAVGKKDTIGFGLHPQSTIGIDQQFGEENIIGKPFREGLEVRIIDHWQQYVNGQLTSYHSKRQIVPRRFEVLNIIIRSDHFPITASWNNEALLAVDSISGSIITSIHPGGWFDTGSPSNMGIVDMGSRNSITFSSNLEGGFNDSYAYVLNDTMPTYWFTFAPSGFIVANTEPDEGIGGHFHIYPNPSNGAVYVENNSNRPISRLQLYNEQGHYITSSIGTRIELGQQAPGLYYLKICTKGNKSYVKKIIRH